MLFTVLPASQTPATARGLASHRTCVLQTLLEGSRLEIMGIFLGTFMNYVIADLFEHKHAEIASDAFIYIPVADGKTVAISHWHLLFTLGTHKAPCD